MFEKCTKYYLCICCSGIFWNEIDLPPSKTNVFHLQNDGWFRRSDFLAALVKKKIRGKLTSWALEADGAAEPLRTMDPEEAHTAVHTRRSKRPSWRRWTIVLTQACPSTWLWGTFRFQQCKADFYTIPSRLALVEAALFEGTDTSRVANKELVETFWSTVCVTRAALLRWRREDQSPLEMFGSLADSWSRWRNVAPDEEIF